MSFNQGAPTVPTLINSSAVLVTGNAVSANALTVRQFGTGNVFSAQTTTGATALFVGANGNVGIGTASPGYLLDVLGILRAGSPVSASIYLTNSEVKWRGDGTAHFSIFNQNSTLQIRNTSGNFEPGTAGSNLVTINTTGYVGIGTTNPYGILHVDSGGAASNIATAQPMASGALIAGAVTGAIGQSGEYSPLLQFRQRWFTTTDTVATGGISGRKDNGSGGYGGGLQFWYGPNGSPTLSPGMALDWNGRVGIGTVNPGYQLDLSGDGARKLTTATWLTGSDERIKTDIQSADLQTCYDTIKSIDLKYFKWNFPAESNVTVDDNHSLGFIAQDVKKVFPNAVSETNSYGFTDFLSLNTDQILKAMYGALRQTMADKESLEQRLAALEARLAAAGL
jgi:hypothetical protein